MRKRVVALVALERVENHILLVRGHKVLLDADLAALYGVETRVLNQAVKRNPDRFPSDFVFRLSEKELKAWRSQVVISNPGAKMGLRRAPYAFTEHGALMAATVLNSSRAVETSVYVVRAFVRLRRLLATHKELARRLAEHEEADKPRSSDHWLDEHDSQPSHPSRTTGTPAHRLCYPEERRLARCLGNRRAAPCLRKSARRPRLLPL